MVRAVRWCVALTLAALAVGAVTACAPKAQPKLEPKVLPPAIKETGTLRAGIDLAYPPFGGTEDGRQAGLDLDTAAALAEKLGLKLAVVDVKASEAATALAEGKVDVVMSVPFSSDLLTRASIAGTYITDGPAFFIATEGTASVEPSLTLDTVHGPVGTQEESVAYWKLVSEFDTAGVTTFPTLRDAIEALDRGKVKVVGADALVAAYIARDFPKVHFAGQIEPAHPLGVATAAENTALSDAVRTALDSLAADGVLRTIRTKWVGELPTLEVPVSEDASGSVESTLPLP